MPEYQKNKRGLLGPLTRSRTLSRVAVMAVAFGVYGSVPEWPWCSEFRNSGHIPTEIHAALTLVLGWLLVFRTNTAYGRWWEARTIWGEIVSVSRTLAAKYAHMVNLPEDDLDFDRLCTAVTDSVQETIARAKKVPKAVD